MAIFFPLIGLRRVDLGPDQNSVNALVVVRRDHDNVRAPKRRLEHASAPRRRKLNIAGEQRIDTSGGAATDEDRFDFYAVLFEETPFLGNPDGAVGRAERPHADTNFVDAPDGCRVNITERHHQKTPKNCLSHSLYRSISISAIDGTFLTAIGCPVKGSTGQDSR